MKMKMVAGAFVVLGTLGTLSGFASAGEITGHGGNTPINPDGVPHNDDSVAASICAFSGLNDEFYRAPGDSTADRTQTPARVGRYVGIACNGA